MSISSLISLILEALNIDCDVGNSDGEGFKTDDDDDEDDVKDDVISEEDELGGAFPADEAVGIDGCAGVFIGKGLTPFIIQFANSSDAPDINNRVFL